MNSKSKVFFFYQGINLKIPNKIKLTNFIESIFEAEKKNLKFINYIFCSDKFLLSVNKKYLNNSYYTDTISFNLSDTKNEIIAEVYISIPRIKENSKLYTTSFKSELHRVVFHGTLHICGYSDKKKSEKVLMLKKENKYLELFFK